MKKLSAYALRRSVAQVFYGSVMSLPLALQAQAETAAITDSIFGGETQASVGVGVAGGPRYMGSKDYRSVPVPVLSLSRGIFFVDTYRARLAMAVAFRLLHQSVIFLRRWQG